MTEQIITSGFHVPPRTGVGQFMILLFLTCTLKESFGEEDTALTEYDDPHIMATVNDRELCVRAVDKRSGITSLLCSSDHLTVCFFH
jgi:hypothetical protein